MFLGNANCSSIEHLLRVHETWHMFSELLGLDAVVITKKNITAAVHCTKLTMRCTIMQEWSLLLGNTSTRGSCYELTGFLA